MDFEATFDGCAAEWFNLGAGLWLVAAPFMLGFGGTPLPAVNCISVGAMVAALAASALSLDKEIEKWWHSSSSRTDV